MVLCTVYCSVQCCVSVPSKGLPRRERERDRETTKKLWHLQFSFGPTFEEFILIHVLDPDFTGKDHGSRSRSVHIYASRTDQLYQSCLHESTNAYITSFKRLLRISNNRIMIQSWPICEMQSYLECLILSVVLLKVFFNMNSYQLSPSCARRRSSMVPRGFLQIFQLFL
jgi:hypothetical protein